MMHRRKLAVVLVAACFPGLAILHRPAPEKALSPSPTYADIAPIFDDNCLMCHNGPKAPKGLRLDTYDNVIKGSDRGAIVSVGDPQGSELVKRIRGKSTPRMPLSGPPWLDETETLLIEEWITTGAPPGPASTAAGSNQQQVRSSTGDVTFRDIAPLIKTNCVKCHNHRGLTGPPPEGLVLASYQDILNGSERVYVVPGNPDASELIRKIRGQSLPRMPFDGPPYLSSQEVVLVEQWVAQGAMDEQGNRASMPAGRKVRLRGRLTGKSSLDGLPLPTGPRSERRRGVSVGDYVEVRGWVTESGGIQVDRIRASSPNRHPDDD
jgi:hypothetical protein